MLIDQCDLIIKSLWLSCLVMCPAGSIYAHCQPLYRKTSDICMSLLSAAVAVKGPRLADRSHHTPLISCIFAACQGHGTQH